MASLRLRFPLGAEAQREAFVARDDFAAWLAASSQLQTYGAVIVAVLAPPPPPPPVPPPVRTPKSTTLLR